MSDALLVRGFSPQTHKSYQAVISKTIVIDGLFAAEWVRFWLDPPVTWSKPRVSFWVGVREADGKTPGELHSVHR
jgi:hypothetical protein